ncbi:MAG: DUF4959 domain-containing protein [Prevotellaceae bacterium]|jgi:hypothetical protein|nr:DUF4959 domain-containing protein [Prevotellaceae bacterium]
MKHSIITVISFLVAGLFYSCTEEPIGQQPIDSVAPGAVDNVQVINVHGGAKISYTLPDDEDLLYVKAVYTRNGEQCESRTSLYRDTLYVEGYGDTLKHEVRVIAVDRSGNESQPVIMEIKPLEPEVSIIGRSLELISDFGGVTASWQNLSRAEISVVILQENEMLSEYVPIETFYSSMAAGKGSVHGMDTIASKFRVFVQDHWGNQSEAKNYELTPIYETLFDRLKFSDASLPGDGPHFSGGWPLSNAWNGVWGRDEGYSSQGGTGTWPQSVTIDMGVLGQISRVRIHQRMGSYTWSEGNLKLFEIYGCQTLDPSGNWDSWTLLMDCESVKPSGLPTGQNSNEDIAVATDGEDFFNSPLNPKVRYIRIKVKRTWAGGDNFQLTEIEVFGDNR